MFILFCMMYFYQPDEQAIKKYNIHVFVDENEFSKNYLSKIVETALREPIDPNWNEEQQNFINNYRKKIESVANIIWHSDQDVESTVELPSYSFNTIDEPRVFGNFPGGHKITCCPFDFIMHFNYLVRLNYAVNNFSEWRARESNGYSKTPKFSLFTREEEHSIYTLELSNKLKLPDYVSSYDEFVFVPQFFLGCYPDPYFRSERLIVYELKRRINRADGRIIMETRLKEEFIPGDDIVDVMRAMDMNSGILNDYIRLIEEGKIYPPTLNKYGKTINTK
jgi:hypothetical protein